MPIRCILFDLDGTLLPMDQKAFVKIYFGGIAKKLAPHGYDPEVLVKAIWGGIAAMTANDGTCTNETRFWQVFRSVFGDRVENDLCYFNEYYEQNFEQVRAVCGCDPKAAETVNELKRRGYRVALATNPVFPAIATRKRMSWGGFVPEDFEVVTSFENSTYCKPTNGYYREVAAKLGARPEECLMVGNDISDDMPAAEIGMKVFLLTPCLIAKEGENPDRYPNGGFEELMRYIDSLEK